MKISPRHFHVLPAGGTEKEIQAAAVQNLWQIIGTVQDDNKQHNAMAAIPSLFSYTASADKQSVLEKLS